MKKTFGLIILYLSLTLFIWANFILQDEYTLEVENPMAISKEVIESSGNIMDDDEINSFRPSPKLTITDINPS
jgi:hypothetical protein